MNRPEFLPALSDETLPFPHADEVCIGEIVCRDLLECGPEVPLHEAARRMSERRVSSILVVEDDVVLGIWTERDALAVDFDDPATFTLAVREAMSAPVRTVPAATLLHELAVRFREEHLRHYLVVDEAGRRIGIVSQSDVVLNQGIEHYLKLRKVDSLVKGGLHALPATAGVGEAALKAFGRITHLVNNAGGSGPNDPLKMSAEKFEGVFRFNVSSAYELTRLCVPHMRAAGGGNVINITSGAARYAQPYFSAYGTAKAALSQLTRLLAQDFAPDVRVNAIAPGPIMTAALDRALPANMREGMIKNTPLKRLGAVEDIAAAALYLATPASAWVTGKIIEVDGGAESSVWPG